MNALTEAAAKVAQINNEIEEGRAALIKARSVVDQLETKLPILHDDLSEAEANLALAAKNFKLEKLEADEGTVTAFPVEAQSPGASRAAEIPTPAGEPLVVPGAGATGDVPNGGVSLDASVQIATNEDGGHDPNATFQDVADALETTVEALDDLVNAEAGKVVTPSEAMLNELDAEDGEGPAF
jgi:hypothetical protein